MTISLDDNPTVTHFHPRPVSTSMHILHVAISTTVVLCLISGALLYRLNHLIDAGLQAQYQCVEKKAK